MNQKYGQDEQKNQYWKSKKISIMLFCAWNSDNVSIKGINLLSKNKVLRDKKARF